MNQETFDKVVQELTEDRKKVAEGKREDYTKGDEDVLKNFKNQAEALGLTPMQSLAVHMEKQISAVFNYIKTNGQSESEPIIKRIGDSINYLELLWGLINDGKQKKERKLCYIDNGFAYFTTNFEDVWGDDWDDIPYEHNAGEPYEEYDIKKVAFDGEFNYPHSGKLNSEYSVQMINDKETWWLHDFINKRQLYAGATIEQFKNFVEFNDGKVFV